LLDCAFDLLRRARNSVLIHHSLSTIGRERFIPLESLPSGFQIFQLSDRIPGDLFKIDHRVSCCRIGCGGKKTGDEARPASLGRPSRRRKLVVNFVQTASGRELSLNYTGRTTPIPLSPVAHPGRNYSGRDSVSWTTNRDLRKC
jgi:hypothetical protein